MVSQEVKAIFGYLILLVTVIAFIMAFAASSYLLSVVFIVGGLLTWMIYLNIGGVRIARPTGAILIIFGVLLASAVFMAFGVEQDLWGGYRLKSDGAILSLIILFFGVMPGLVFYYLHKPTPTETPAPPHPRPTTPPQEPDAAEAQKPPYYDYEQPEWDEEYYEQFDPEAWAAYYEGAEYEEDE